MFNHSSSPNVNFLRNYDTNTIRFSASRTIQAGEELCISYAADESKLWFVKTDPTSASNSAGANGSMTTAVSDDEDSTVFPPIELLALDENEDAEDRQRRLARQARLDGSTCEPGRRERKNAQYMLKKQAAAAAADVDTCAVPGSKPAGSLPMEQPTPVRPAAVVSASTTTSRPDTPNYPAIPERTVSSPALPAPLHSGEGKSRHEHVGPVILTPELDWREEDYSTRSSSREGSAGDEEDEWSGIERIKGFTEREEDQQLADDQGLGMLF